MILGVVIGIIGIIFACLLKTENLVNYKKKRYFFFYLAQVDGFMNKDQISNPNLIPTNVNEYNLRIKSSLLACLSF